MPPTEDIPLRRCGAADAEALSLVGAATFLETFAGVLPGADVVAHCVKQHGVAQYAAWLAAPGYRFGLAELAAAPVGFAMLAPPDLPVATTPEDLELKRIYVLRRFQGTGLGRRLLDWSREEARAQGKRRLLLGVKADNIAALAFYNRVGFLHAGERRFLVGATWHDDYILSLAL